MLQLTGAHRYRLHNRLFRKPLLVLQVEVHQDPVEIGDMILSLEKTFWRDASVEDMVKTEKLPMS